MHDTTQKQEGISAPDDAANNNSRDGLEGALNDVEPEERSADDRLVALEAELAEQKDRLLRAPADTENTRRRAQRERSAMHGPTTTVSG